MAQIDLNIKYTVNLSYNYIKALIWSNTSNLTFVYSCIKKSVFHVNYAALPILFNANSNSSLPVNTYLSIQFKFA